MYRQYRLEGSTRSEEIESGLQSQIADALWLLARQWQVGEFHGEDAASPIQARYATQIAPVDQFRPYAGKQFRSIDPFLPLEAYAEQQPLNDAASFWRAAEAGQHLLRLLAPLDNGKWRKVLRDEYALTMPSNIEPQDVAVVALMVRRSCDGERIYLERARLEAEFVKQDEDFEAMFSAWVAWFEDRLFDDSALESWDPERMEYRFSAGATTSKGTIVLDAKEYPGGHLDWFSFDKRDNAVDLPKDGKGELKTVIPTPVQFSGMAVQRWFEFEDGTVNFGDVSAGAVDFARMITAAFATAFGDDWYVMPVRVPIGSLAQIGTLTVLDSFGDTHPIRSIAANDGTKRVWRFFELNGDDDDPLLFVPSVALGRLEGKAVERVTLLRDETENLGWGIEKAYEGVLERSVERGRQWTTARSQVSSQGVSDDESWQYRLLNPIPPYWIPFVPVRMTGSAQIRLRRGRMSEWELLPPEMIGIRGTTLLPDPAAPLNVYEEEVPASGIDVSSSYQFARHASGQAVVWLGRRKQAAQPQITLARETDRLKRQGE